MSDRDDTLARLSVMAAEARASLLAHGLNDTSDTRVAGAITDATAELDAAVRTSHGLVVRALRRRREALVALHEYLAAVERARRALAGETT